MIRGLYRFLGGTVQRVQNFCVGIDQGEVILFSDFEDEGEMWAGTGPRERRQAITFSEAFQTLPVVQVGLAMWDIDMRAPSRVDLRAENVSAQGFDCVFRTWADTRVARVRVSWIAIGGLRQPDDWDLY